MNTEFTKAVFHVRLLAHLKSGEVEDLGLFTFERPVGEYDTLNEAAALQILKGLPEVGYRIEGGLLEVAGSVIPISDLRRLEAHIVAKAKVP